MVARFNYQDRIKLLREQKEYLGKIIEHLYDAKVKLVPTEEFLETHLTNYYFQLTSFDLLMSGTKVFSENDNKFFDLSSIFILTRSLIENYFCIHYLYFEPIDDIDLARFRYYLYNIHGLNIRQEMLKENTPTQSTKIKLQSEQVLLEKYVEKLTQNAHFKTLHPKKQKQLIKDKPARDVSLTSLVSKPYFSINIFKQNWALLSNYAHSEYISVLQLRTIFKDPEGLKKNPSLLRLNLFSLIMLNSSLLHQLAKRFKAAEIMYNRFPIIFRKNNNMWFNISQKNE